MGDTVLVRSSGLLGEELEKPGGSIDAFEEEGKGRVCRGQGEACSSAGEKTQDFGAPLDRIDKVNHRG
ncbi:MAG TPA: hypothetical protein VK689_08150 [Armatimonadota bacterium]|nr:hypothetical protein [Armatimonadota bacterium]